jgi:ABC-type nitrate/sulfonate/bicarbonate transport system substrate-binding protein
MLRQTHFVPPVPLIAAAHLGLLADSDVQLQQTDTRGSEEQFHQLHEAEQDLAVTAMDNIFEWTRRDPGIRIIAQVERATPLVLVARPPRNTLADLEGCVFAVDAMSNGFVLAARHVLDAAGITVQWTEVGGVRERMQALLAGAADASLLGPPFDTIALSEGLHRIASVDEMIRGYPGQGLLASPRALSDHRDELAAYLAVLGEAVRRTNTMTDEEGLSLLEDAGYPPAAAAALWRERPRTLRVDLDGFRTVASIRQQLDLMPAAGVRVEDLIDGDLLEGPRQ